MNLRDSRHEPSSPGFHKQQRWAYQTEALIKTFNLDMLNWDLSLISLKKIRSSPPNCRTLTAVTKMSKRFAVCNWAQIRSDNRGEHIKRKPLTTPSNLMLTLAVKLIISTKKMTSKKGGGAPRLTSRVSHVQRLSSKASASRSEEWVQLKRTSTPPTSTATCTSASLALAR